MQLICLDSNDSTLQGQQIVNYIALSDVRKFHFLLLSHLQMFIRVPQQPQEYCSPYLVEPSSV